MSYPILYGATETNFDHNGIGILSACVSCEVTEEANGIFELAMQYPMDGIHYAEIADRAIIKANADQFRDPQLFRVYAISKPMNGIVTVLAEHISYDLSGIPVKPFSAESAASAFLGIKNNAVVDCPFDFWTDKGTAAKFTVSTPASIRSRLGGADGSILDVYGGEYEFDNFTVKLHNSRGLNRGVSIRYGKNLTDIQQDQNCSNVATGIYPYWAGMVEEKDVLVELPEKIVNAPGTYNFVKIRTLDLSGEFETQPTVEQLRSKAETYIQNNNIGVPVVSWSVSFEQLTKSEEYKHLALLERVSLFDTVNVEFPALGVSATAKAVKVVYDSLADRVKSVTLGSVRANIADTIANQQTEIDKTKEKPSLSMVQKISSALAKAIMGANGGSVRLIDTNEDGDPDELYIADDPDPMKAVKVWRFNYNGWAASKNGYSGPFEFGATLKDGLLANFVTAAKLVAGTINSADGKTFFADLDNGILKMNATEFSVSGKSVNDIAEEKTNIVKKELDEFTDMVTSDIESLQNQIDGSITTWFENYIPTVNNQPAINWTTYKLRNQHLGDLFYIVNNTEFGGRVYRWALVNNSYDWQIVEDSDVTKALADAAKAQDTADGKRRVFVVQPTPPYDKGDLWTDGVDLRVCSKSRTSGSYFRSDWVLATDYIDSDTAAVIAQGKVNSQTQMDIFNKLTNNGAVEGIYIKDGQVFINASYLATGILASKNGKTFYLDLDNGILKGQFSEFSISGKTVDDIAQEKANAAESSAISVAASDAAAKANAAKIKAVSAASEDASNKANAALSSAKSYADSAASAAVNAQTQMDIFNKLTNNGAVQGFYIRDGKLYINAALVKVLNLVATNIVSGKLSSADGKTYFDLDNSKIVTKGDRTSAEIKNGFIQIYGKNYVTNVLEQAIIIDPGYKMDGSWAYSSVQAPNGYGLSVFGNGGTEVGTYSSETDIKGSKVTVRGKIIGSTESWETTLSNSGSNTHTCARTPVAVIVGAQYQGTGLVTGMWTPATSGLENSMYGATGGYTDVWPTTVTIKGKNVTVKRGGSASLKYFVTAIMQMD